MKLPPNVKTEQVPVAVGILPDGRVVSHLPPEQTLLTLVTALESLRLEATVQAALKRMRGEEPRIAVVPAGVVPTK